MNKSVVTTFKNLWDTAKVVVRIHGSLILNYTVILLCSLCENSSWTFMICPLFFLYVITEKNLLTVFFKVRCLIIKHQVH